MLRLELDDVLTDEQVKNTLINLFGVDKKLFDVNTTEEKLTYFQIADMTTFDIQQDIDEWCLTIDNMIHNTYIIHTDTNKKFLHIITVIKKLENSFKQTTYMISKDAKKIKMKKLVRNRILLFLAKYNMLGKLDYNVEIIL